MRIANNEPLPNRPQTSKSKAFNEKVAAFKAMLNRITELADKKSEMLQDTMPDETIKLFKSIHIKWFAFFVLRHCSCSLIKWETIRKNNNFFTEFKENFVFVKDICECVLLYKDKFFLYFSLFQCMQVASLFF